MKSNFKKLIILLLILILTLSAIKQTVDLMWLIYQQQIGTKYIKEAIQYYREYEFNSEINNYE
jgi:uncharacterized membrane protein